jgi:hypothetical protein
VYPDTSLAKGQSDAPGTDAKLKSGTRAGQVREEAHRGINDRRLEQLGPFTSYVAAIRSSK